jgi:small nuclear ribonucleoprotein (snRNP)-like protein
VSAAVYPFRRFVVHRRVVVNLTSGRAIEGVVLERDGPLLVIADAVVHEPGAEPSGVDGHVVVERRQVDFIQAVPGR